MTRLHTCKGAVNENEEQTYYNLVVNLMRNEKHVDGVLGYVATPKLFISVQLVFRSTHYVSNC